MQGHGVLGPQTATLASRLPRETWEYSSPPPGASTTDTRRREGGRQAELEVLQQNSFTLEWGEGGGEDEGGGEGPWCSNLSPAQESCQGWEDRGPA